MKVKKIINISLSVLLFIPVFLLVLYAACPLLILLAVGIFGIPPHFITKPVLIFVSIIVTTLIILSACFKQEKIANKAFEIGGTFASSFLISGLIMFLIAGIFIYFLLSQFGSH